MKELLCFARVCTPKDLLHQATFTSEDPYNRDSRLFTQKPLHQKPFTPQAIRTKEVLHQKHPASNDLKLSTPGTGTFYTLASEVSTPKNFAPKSFTPDTVFTRNSPKVKVFLSQEPLATGNFTPEGLHEIYFVRQRISSPKHSKISGASHQRALIHRTTRRQVYTSLFLQQNMSIPGAPRTFIPKSFHTKKPFTLKTLHTKDFYTKI